MICSGSMLGVNYQRIESNSVGYKSEFDMYSLDLEEFLWAKGYGEDVINELLENMKKCKPFNQTTMSIFSSLFLDYTIIGGMSRVILEYIERKTFEGALDLQQELIRDYKEDIKKYVIGLDKTRVLNVLNYIPVQLVKENKKF